MDEGKEIARKPLSLETRITRRSLLCMGGKAAVSLATPSLSRGFESRRAQAQEDKIPPLPEYTSPDPNQKALVVLLKDRGASPPFSKDHMEELMETVNNFYVSNSYGKIHYTTTLLNWHDTDNPLEPTNLEGIAAMGDGVVEQAEIPEDPNTTRIYVVDRRGKNFDVGGRGEKNEPFNRIWINADEWLEEGIIEHELGHALGIDHTEVLLCQSQNDYTNNCESKDASRRGGYTYVNDIMASGDSRNHFNAPDKIIL